MHKKHNDKRLRVIFILLIIGFTVDAYSKYLEYYQKENFIPFNIWVLLETMLLYFLFFKVLENSIFKKLIISLCVIFPMIWAIYFNKVGTEDYMDIVVTYQNVTIIAFSIFYFYEQIASSEPVVIYNKSIFWVVTSYLIYSAGTLFLFIYLRFFPDDEQIRLRTLNYLLNILKFVLLTVGMFMKDEQQGRKQFELS